MRLLQFRTSIFLFANLYARAHGDFHTANYLQTNRAASNILDSNLLTYKIPLPQHFLTTEATSIAKIQVFLRESKNIWAQLG